MGQSGSSEQQQVATTPTRDEESISSKQLSTGLKPCCACPETKSARDDCIIIKGEEDCQDLIEAHKTCMRKLGFNV
jgi:cytochrome c oxidase assembly protein subunit 17